MITIEIIKEALDSGKVPLEGDIIKQGNLVTDQGLELPYDLYFGWDIQKCYACDQQWGAYNIRLMEFIQAQNYNVDKLNEVLADIQVDDDCWSWFNKSILYREKGYYWFFLMADGKQQAACLIYHPKKSAFEKLDVFYIEYIAVAPWNRENPMEQKNLSGVGGLMVKSIVEYASAKLGFGYGFSLHSIPKACGFYTRIGMQRYQVYDKGLLQYFEMPEKVAFAYMGLE